MWIGFLKPRPTHPGATLPKRNLWRLWQFNEFDKSSNGRGANNGGRGARGRFNNDGNKGVTMAVMPIMVADTIAEVIKVDMILLIKQRFTPCSRGGSRPRLEGSTTIVVDRAKMPLH
jgi:hypothetical protein